MAKWNKTEQNQTNETQNNEDQDQEPEINSCVWRGATGWEQAFRTHPKARAEKQQESEPTEYDCCMWTVAVVHNALHGSKS